MWLRTCLSHTHEAPVAGNLRWRSGVTVNKTRVCICILNAIQVHLVHYNILWQRRKQNAVRCKKTKTTTANTKRVSAPLHCSIRLLMGILHLQYLCHFYKCMPLQMYFYTLRFTSGCLLFIRRVKSLFNSLTLKQTWIMWLVEKRCAITF